MRFFSLTLSQPPKKLLIQFGLHGKCYANVEGMLSEGAILALADMNVISCFTPFALLSPSNLCVLDSHLPYKNIQRINGFSWSKNQKFHPWFHFPASGKMVKSPNCFTASWLSINCQLTFQILTGCEKKVIWQLQILVIETFNFQMLKISIHLLY